MTKSDKVRVVPSAAPGDGEGYVRNVPGNYYDKHGSRNPLVQHLMRRFHVALIQAVSSVPHETLLDVGCGEGRTTAVLDAEMASRIVGVELEPVVMAEAMRSVPAAEFAAASVYKLPFRTDSFDVVTSTEVLEHLDAPEMAISELLRVAQHAVILTVPHEPWWRIANMARGQYLRDFGNTPGHVQHWSNLGLRRFLRTLAPTADIKAVGLWSLAIIRT